jgi:hypothetical protein
MERFPSHAATLGNDFWPSPIGLVDSLRLRGIPLEYLWVIAQNGLLVPARLLVSEGYVLPILAPWNS